MKSFLNVPIVLTLIRLILAPCVLPFLLVIFSPYESWWVNSCLAGCFVLFGLTDFFDGYLARKFKQETLLGTILDPLADKFLVFSVLIALLAVGKIYFYWVLLFIGREFFVMGLRHIALEHQLALRVSFLAKIKTVAQMLYLTVVIANAHQKYGLCGAPVWNGSELFLLVAALFLSLLTAYHYYRVLVREYNLCHI